ncbi:MAG: YceH family protein [Crocinitomicaceae bacterium]|nr:YceH family protein [Crocinitomicaceae bacterium]
MNNQVLVQLSDEEIRVLGALIEKSKTTPDYYPMTLNGIVTACNQKSSRNPVVKYDNDTVINALDSLRKKELTAKVLGDGRSTKYRHTLSVKHSLDLAELTVLGLLFLRGPLTTGEINSMSGRMFDFENLEEVQKTVEQLMEVEIPFVHRLPKITGQKEARLVHLFSEIPSVDELDPEVTSNIPTSKTQELEQRIESLENQLSKLQADFDNLMKELS